ncbi:hypothetical protein B0H65DRAFT_436882 [Neurospora tetraspora]|uniref:Uncharacterized protein n=1 Tax=Neurospora tetraspora TaxID=94610 RepID=A0AAE0MJ73_9PEZI|nr:hypothetical protein B0H65DRAFT_436882 [Neurospora tetraspora]
MPVVKDPPAFDGHANHAASDPIALKTTFGGSEEPYPIALLEDAASDAAHPIRDSTSDSGHHNHTTHLIVDDNAVRNCNNYDSQRANEHGCGRYRVITDDLIDPILLAWEEDHKIAFFTHRMGASTDSYSDSDILLKTSVNFILNATARAPITGFYAPATCNFPNPANTFLASNHHMTGNHSTGTSSPNFVNPIPGSSNMTRPNSIQPTNTHHVAKVTAPKPQVASAHRSITKAGVKKSTITKCRECKPGKAGWAQIYEWAAQGILTCTDCMKRPQRAAGKLCDECFQREEE